MAGPVAPFVSPIISAATAHAQKRIDEARARDRDRVGRLIAYLRAIVEAVKGLEAEADELLSECRWMDWADQEQRQAFLSRCGGYLDVDRLRLQLSAALEGLNESRQVLRERAEERMQRSRTKARREAVLAEVDATLDSHNQYLAGLRLGRKTSGVAAAELDWVRRLLAEVKTPEQAETARASALPTIDASYASRRGHEVLGALESLVVRVQDAFA